MFAKNTLLNTRRLWTLFLIFEMQIVNSSAEQDCALTQIVTFFVMPTETVPHPVLVPHISDSEIKGISRSLG